MAELSLRGVTKRFGPVTAVAGLSLDVRDGEFLVLLGPTGAGKTTTLRLVAGLEVPDDGRILIGGIDVTRLPPAARDVAFVFQSFSLYPHLDVYDNLAFPLRAPARRRSEAEIRRRVHEVASLLRLEGKLRNRATTLSGGEMQRVAIGRALVREPQLFLMDEPLSSLDAKLRETLRVELKRIQRDLGATILYVTHDQTEATSMADRIGVLEEGRLLQLASPREIYERPADVRVARRLGSPAINLLRADRLPELAPPPGAARIGVRPEDVRVGEGPFEAQVRQVEPIGADAVVLLAFRDLQLHALIDGCNGLRVGSLVAFGFAPGRTLFFDREGRLLNGEARASA
jgi:multiple sugar transport system ATP-binding protein